MLLDDPACFRLDCIPARPIHWLWRPYLACGNSALLDGDPGAGVWRPDAGAGQAAPRRRRPARAEGRPGMLAVVQFDLAARRQSTPMRVRPTDPCRAPCRPYGLGRRPIRSADGTSRGKSVGKIQCPTPLRPGTFLAKRTDSLSAAPDSRAQALSFRQPATNLFRLFFPHFAVAREANGNALSFSARRLLYLPIVALLPSRPGWVGEKK